MGNETCLTDAFPIKGYHRRPYFVVAGVLGFVSALMVALLGKLPIALALACLIGMSAGVAIADVVIDACIARNGIEIWALAPDMQSLSGFASSAGSLIGYSTSSFSIHHLGTQGALGLLAIPPAFLIILGFLIYETRSISHRSEKKKLLYGISGMLDLIFVLQWSLALGIPDSFFVIMERCVSHIISRIRWIPMIVLSTRLCPIGMEGTFFALLMCIDSVGSLTSKWAGGMVFHLLHVTRTNLTDLWLVILIGNILRLATLGLIFLVPKADHSDDLIPLDLLRKNSDTSADEEGLQNSETSAGEEGLQLVPINPKNEEVA